MSSNINNDSPLPLEEEAGVRAATDNIAIRVSNLSKCYQIYDAPRDRLKQFVIPKLCRAIPVLRRFFSTPHSPLPTFYKEFWALKDVSFEIKRGETVGIIGRNGSGKSTLLQVLCGTLSPTVGDIEIHGKIAALLELGAGFNPEFTGRENVFLAAALYGLSHEQIESRFDQIVSFADIGAFIEQPVKTYSSGMFVRLAFAVIANVDADILIIDEALAVGDAYFVQKCMRYLRGFTKKGTLLFVSHDTSAVISLCSNAIHMSSGKIENMGSPQNVANLYLALLHMDSIESTTPSETTEPQRPTEKFDGAQSKRIFSSIKIDSESGNYGTGAAQIVGVALETLKGKPVVLIAGGEKVRLVVLCRSFENIPEPIVGFALKDRLGQVVFGHNTYDAYANKPGNCLKRSDELTATFEFEMPVLQTGEYVIDIAMASGTQVEHIQHHWVHSAVTFRAQPKTHCFGLFEVSMSKVLLERAKPA